MTILTARCLTAQQFIAQGTSAASVASIARYLDSEAAQQPKLAAAVRLVAEEVAALTGVKLYGKRGYYVAPRKRSARPVNDNRKRRRAA